MIAKTSINRFRFAVVAAALLGLATIHGCLPKPMSEGGGGINITLYGFSIMKEPLEKAIYPAFADKASPLNRTAGS